MSQPQLESAFVDWVNTFEKFSSSPITSLNDLTDGTVLTDILWEIDPKLFKSGSRRDTSSRKENWVLKRDKLKKVYAFLTRHFEETLGLSAKNIGVIDIDSMVGKGNLKETIKFCSLVVTLAVRQANNEVYIEKIQSLSPKTQEGLMISIESVMKQLGDSTISTPDKQSNYIAEEEVRQINLEYKKILSEREALQKAHQALMEEHTTLREQYDELQSELEDLKQKLKEGGKVEFLLKTEANLRSDLSRSEERCHELELALDSSKTMIAELTRKVDLLEGYAEEVARLKDQLDENRHEADKLRKTENAIEKFKKKLEDSKELRKLLKNLEEENQHLLLRSQELENECKNVKNLKKAIDTYKQQTIELQTEKTELINEKNKYEYEYRHWRGKAEAYKSEISRDTETIHLLEDRIRELGLGEGERLNLEEEGNDADENDQTINDSELSDALKGTTMTTLKLKIHELERELERLREGKSTDSEADSNLILQSMLDDANRMKERYEQDYVNVQKEKLSLQSQLASCKCGSGSNKLDSRAINRDSTELVNTKRDLVEAQLKLSRLEKKMKEPKSDPNLENRMKNMEAENGELRRQNENLMDFLKNLESNNNDENGEDTKNQIAQFRKKFDNSKKILVGYHTIVDELTKENESYKNKIVEMEKRYAEEFALMTSAWYNIGRRIQGDHVSIQRRKPMSFLAQQRMNHDNQLKRR